MAFPEPPALAAALEHAEPSAPTACTGWTAHDIAAHLAAGAKEMADLIEEHLAGRPPRATQGYEARERPFRALDHDELLARMVEHSRRNVAATRALSERGGAASVVFTGAELTAEQLTGPPSVCRGPSGCWRTLGSHRAIATVACGSTASMSPARPGGPGRADWQ
jgi:uncharacterized protein (TIGR03083 family)